MKRLQEKGKIVIYSLYMLPIYTYVIFFPLRLQKWELNTYLYAPKDDYKHRMFWREMYSVEEAGNLFLFNP